MTTDAIGLAGTGPRSKLVAHLLRKGGNSVALWRPGRDDEPIDAAFPDGVHAVEREDLADVSLVFVCVSLADIRRVARRLGDVLTGRHVLVHTIRTLEADGLGSISSVLEEETPTRRLGLLTGPMSGDDILEDRGASALCASPFEEVADLVEEALSSPRFRVYRNDDLVGSETAASYARVLALGYGMAEAYGLGRSVLSTLFARGLAEMATFVVEQDGGDGTTFGLAGAGNLHADTTGEGSVDYRIGREYVRRDGPDLEVFRADLAPVEAELFDFVRSLREHQNEETLDALPILTALGELLFGERTLEGVFEALMELPDLRERPIHPG